MSGTESIASIMDDEAYGLAVVATKTSNYDDSMHVITVSAKSMDSFSRIGDDRPRKKDSTHVPFWRNLPKRRR